MKGSRPYFGLMAVSLASLFTSTTQPVARAEIIALGDGEGMKFRVGWGIFSNAGEITVSARSESTAGLPGTRVVTNLSTRGVVRTLYKLDAKGDCLFDGRDGRILSALTDSTAGKKHTHTMAVFDYGNNTMHYDDYVHSEKSATLPMPRGDTMDLITCLVQTRAWNIKPGESRMMVAIFEDEFYELQVTAVGYEKVNAPWGEVNALVLSPTTAPGVQPKGMFKKGAVVKVWISQDERRLPVKFQLGLKYGTGTAYLTGYQPPAKGAQSAGFAMASLDRDSNGG